MSERLAACCPMATERHAEQGVEFHGRRLPAGLDRYCVRYLIS